MARGWAIAYDTHYDAANAEISKWAGTALHRLDFQPYPDKGVVVTHYIDRYHVLPRLCRWARSVVPFFPHVAKTESRPLGELELGQPEAVYSERVAVYVQSAA